MPKWILAAVGLTACVVLSAGSEPWIAAASGAFIPADIAQDAAAARLFVDGFNPYGPQIREMHSRLVGMPVAGTFPYFPHPPFSLIVSWPFAYVSYGTAAMLWFSFSLALVFVLAAILAETFSDGAPTGHASPRNAPVLLFFLLLLAWPPVLYNLEKGQWSILLTVLVAMAWRSLSRVRLQAGGIWIGVAAAVKVFPVVLGIYLLLRSWKALGCFVGIGLLLTALPLFCIGFGSFPAFIGQSQLNLPYWETFPSVTFSIHGALARFLVGGQWAHPFTHAPFLAWAVEAGIIVVLLGLAVRTTVRANKGRMGHTESFSAWVVILPMLNPQSLGHNGVLLAVPLVLTARAAIMDGSRWRRAAWVTVLMLVSIPRQTMWRLAPPPVEPWEGLAIIALPMWGALLLFFLVSSQAGSGASVTAASRVI